MLEWLFSWEVTSWTVGGAIAIAFAVLALDDFDLAKLFFLIAAADAAGGVVMWGIKTQRSTSQVALAVGLFVGVIAALTVLAFRYVDKKREVKQGGSNDKAAIETRVSKPSLVFVFGTPLGDNKSPKWLMLLKHFGTDTVHNCDISFVDDDRKNLEHEWLVKHPQSPFLPPGMFDESQKHIHIDEAGPESSIGNFEWVPVNPDSQHYSMSISCRDGVFNEKWEITRVDGVLRGKITIEHGVQWAKKNPTLEIGIFRCEDREFIGTSLATELPKVARPPVHPGWKPNHRFDVPAAIIDPNGNVQIVAAIRAPDGSTITDFGCWNILTKHFGD